MKRSRLGLLALALAVLVSLTLLLPALCRDDSTLQITPAKDSIIIHLDTPEQAQGVQLVLQYHLPGKGYAILKSRHYSGWQ